MKIAEETPDRLTLVVKPWLLALFFAFFFLAPTFILVREWESLEAVPRGFLLFWAVVNPLIARFSVHWITAEFGRTTGRLEIRRAGLAYERRDVYPLKHLKRAIVEESRDEGVSERVAFVFDEAALVEIGEPARTRLEKRRSKSDRAAGRVTIPLTAYYSSASNADRIAKALNVWLGVSNQ